MSKLFTHFSRSLFSTLVLAQHNGKSASKNTYKLLSAAHKFQEEIYVLFIGEGSHIAAQGFKSSTGGPHIKSIFSAQKPSRPTADAVQNVVSNLITKYSYNRIIGLSSSFGKDVIPRISGKYGVQPIGDVTEILDKKTFIRPTYAGNAFSKVRSQQQVDFLTVRASSFSEFVGQANNKCTIEEVGLGDYQEKASFLSQQKSDSNKPELTTARIVVSGGRGLKGKQNFDLIYKLADAFGDAAVGASRAAVDAGYCPNQMQVGQTGKVVAPDLYIAVGISGAVQHLAGMKDSKCIVAINNRPDEPIFEYSDYSLVEDLFKAVPQITEKVKKVKTG